MFTVKVYRNDNMSVSFYEARSVETVTDGDTLVLMNQDSGEQPFIRISSEDDATKTDRPADMVVIENALGKTTEVLRA